MKARSTCWVLAVLLLLCGARWAFAQKEDARKPRPDAAAIDKAWKEISKIYDEELAKAKKPDEKLDLAREFLKLAKETGDDPAAQFVLLYVARNMAAEAKAWALAMEAIAAIVERFQPADKLEPAAMIQRGEALCKTAQKKPAAEREAMRLNAVEWYMYAKQDGTVLCGKLAEKRLAELLKEIGVKKKKADDLELLIGTWDVRIGRSRGLWRFRQDGAFLSGKNVNEIVGKWVADDDKVTVILFSNPKAWQTFYRPISSTVIGDTWQQKGIIRGDKIESP